jgi:hypothetical protein
MMRLLCSRRPSDAMPLRMEANTTESLQTAFHHGKEEVMLRQNRCGQLGQSTVMSRTYLKIESTAVDSHFVIPANAGIQFFPQYFQSWIPAAGMTT